MKNEVELNISQRHRDLKRYFSIVVSEKMKTALVDEILVILGGYDFNSYIII
jgi:hypothetical protein